MNCQIEFANDEVGMLCGKLAVATCSDCGSAICDDCCTECCGDSFCVVCYDYHLTNSCVRKPVRNERHPFPLSDLPDRLVSMSPVLIAGGRQPNKRLLLRQNRITDPVIGISITIQK